MNKFEKKRCKSFNLCHNPNLLVTKQADYQIASGAKITCARFGATNYQLLAAGDD